MIDTIDTSSLKTTIQNAAHIVIIPHLNPDGDAMGSSLGIFHVLKNIGKKVHVVSPSAYPKFLSWMKGADEAVNFEEKPQEAIEILHDADLLVFVDFNCLKRTGKLEEEIRKLDVSKIMIDHHPYPDPIAEVMISVPSSSSTCELAYQTLSSLGWNDFVDSCAAECFYTGIMTDTGSLSYNSSNPETYRMVAGLLEKNIDKDKIHQLVFHSNSFSRMKLLGHVLGSKLVLMPEQEAAYMCLSSKELEAYDFQPGDTEGFVNYPLGIAGINVSAFFMEKEGKVKCSFRSRGDFPVNLFSESHFSGGGHRNAAGGESVLSLELTVDKFKTELPVFYEKFKKNEL
ncbi:DHH family phosphoesterase [Saccharicrinis fermentans]|uniref:Bifunctional oligoribonuclease and PAP phosphatase NrnA n=1 Tax=Saccharicrinis fermentans DSM 9555 = JCM 21142 TaxID=869213 RepID=W7XVL9_9BACT|nr:bifunctional oligoribonuclease/PAP phosphatase NrnA [Saccharicrinis fermentans]GAF02190.1 bifunctional oligoribonuclease and PAP phosphatase NrnA [Saccharicrinis fermentans DSM 9555 = JCM 21142]